MKYSASVDRYCTILAQPCPSVPFKLPRKPLSFQTDGYKYFGVVVHIVEAHWRENKRCIKMRNYGIYFVDATGLEGWTDETLLDALKKPLASIGIGVEIGQHNTGMVFFDNVGYDKIDTLREQASHIIAKAVTQ